MPLSTYPQELDLALPVPLRFERRPSIELPRVEQSFPLCLSTSGSECRPATHRSGRFERRSKSRQAHQPRTAYVNSQESRTPINQDMRSMDVADRQTPLNRRYPAPSASDSGYGTSLPPAIPQSVSTSIPIPDSFQRHNGLIQPSADSPYPGLILQPESCPISQKQLAAEVKGIYAGLVMVEAKCINMDATQAANSKPVSPLASSQWQALIALHRTLLHEHHDLLMATQHPSANNALRDLAAKYSMPARMWKHGIHAFLEVLRHRRPESQDFMLSFIYLAYQMMALLFETVPSFTDTWIECLGDLARYRMAIEEEMETRSIWGTVAARWYTMASDRYPVGGRMYHHLGVLGRPTHTLTCMTPAPNARDSYATLCNPIYKDDGLIHSSSRDHWTRVAAFRASTLDSRTSAIEILHADALASTRTHYVELRDCDAYLTLTNIAALFDLCFATNDLWQLYSYALNQILQSLSPVTFCGSTFKDELCDEASRHLRTLNSDSFAAHIGDYGRKPYPKATIWERYGCFDDDDDDTSVDLDCTPSVSSETIERFDLQPSLPIPSTFGTAASTSVASRARKILRWLASKYSGSSRSIHPLASFAATFALFGRAFASGETPDTLSGRSQSTGNSETLADIIDIFWLILPFAVLAVGITNAFWIFRSRGSQGSMPSRRCRCQSSYTSMLSLVLSLAFWVIAETTTELSSYNQHLINLTFSLWLAFWLSYLALGSKKVSDNMTFLWATLVTTVITAFSYAAYVSDYRGDERGPDDPVRDIVMRAIRFTPVCATGSSMLFARFLSYQQRTESGDLELAMQAQRRGRGFSAR